MRKLFQVEASLLVCESSSFRIEQKHKATVHAYRHTNNSKTITDLMSATYLVTTPIH